MTESSRTTTPAERRSPVSADEHGHRVRAGYDLGTTRGDMNEERDRRALLAFTAIMWVKLRENAHKRHWSELPSQWLLGRIKDELQELQDAILAGDPVAIRREAADVANLAMMVADNAEKERASR